MSKFQGSIRLDPRTLFLVNLIFCIAALFLDSHMTSYLCFGVAVILMALTGVYKILSKFLIVYAVIILSNFLVSLVDMTGVRLISNMLLYLYLKIAPMWMVAAIMLKTIRINELITALEKARVHRGIVLGVAVAFRFIPTMNYEMSMMRDSMRLRGIECSIGAVVKRPIKTVEFLIVPLLFRSLKVSEELTKTALTRGVEYEGNRSAFYDVGFCLSDFSVLFVLTVGLVGAVFMYAGGGG